MPEAASRIMTWPGGRSSTQDVLPPKKTVGCPGDGIEPRTPQNRTSAPWSSAPLVATGSGGPTGGRWLGQQVIEQFLEFGNLERLHDIAVGAGFLGAFAIGGVIASGDDDDFRVGEVGSVAEGG